MLAVQGIYESGRVTLKNDVPMKRASVLVIFPVEQSNDDKEITREEAFARLKEYRRGNGSTLDYERERDEYLHGKYGSAT
ncbi:MAG: hypothetical protein FWB96_05510 [Defluviitaleaceae bacterium]|nr:hypothetical protein [Defluviitaleaceae bacterium]MCL2262244.1 hypothetical protein [Defluviitaleaceae bacterium]